MAIYNKITGERKYEGQIISERGTFRMDTSMDEVTIWDPENKKPNIIYLHGNDWFVETGSDLSKENLDNYNLYLETQYQKRTEKSKIRKIDALKKGELVTVISGHKVKKGILGRVFFIKQTQYGPRIGIIYGDDSKHYTYAKNVLRDSRHPFTEVYCDYYKEFYHARL